MIAGIKRRECDNMKYERNFYTQVELVKIIVSLKKSVIAFDFLEKYTSRQKIASIFYAIANSLVALQRVTAIRSELLERPVTRAPASVPAKTA